MELRVWVDGVERVVCGVKLTTTCQEIVFALAHATQQTGRFTMVERWINNERLLSPNEQPLVTLQRWGDRMNEVEFILRKSAPTNNSQSIQQPHNVPHTITGQIHHPPPQHLSLSNRASPLMPGSHSTLDHQEHIYHQQLARRPQTVLGGPLIGCNSFVNTREGIQNHSNMSDDQQAVTQNRPASMILRSSASATPLPNSSNIGANIAQPHTRSNLREDSVNSVSHYESPGNGYEQRHNESQPQQLNFSTAPHNSSILNTPGDAHLPKNYPYEDLYSTINKKRSNPPPAVPAKPRIPQNLRTSLSTGQLPLYNNHQQQQQQLRPNLYAPTQNPLNIYGVRQASPSIPRRRCPPGYMDFIEAIAQRGQLAQPASSSSQQYQSNTLGSNNLLQTSYDGRIQNMYPMQQQSQQQHMQTSPMMNAMGTSPGSNASLRYSSSSMTNPPPVFNNSPSNLFHRAMEPQGVSSNRSRFVEPGLIINRGSAVNVKLPPSNQSALNYQSINEPMPVPTSYDKQIDSSMSVSQIGHDMLRVIELQKRMLIDQRNELKKLDTESDYWETKNLEQNELISKIEDEIQQLEKLWMENQTQIQKLENQDFEKELNNLKSDQGKLEDELEKQKEKLRRVETDLVSCKERIETLESELEDKIKENSIESRDDDSSESENETHPKNGRSQDGVVAEPISSTDIPAILDAKTVTNGHKDIVLTNGNGSLSNGAANDHEDSEDDSNFGSKTSPIRPTNSPKELTIDKKGVLYGIRSLKLEKTRSACTKTDLKDALMTNHDRKQTDSTGQLSEHAANSNKYQFLMYI